MQGMKVLLTRSELAERWSVDVKTIANWENEQIIQRVKGIPTPRYRVEEIEKIEGIKDASKFSPVERKILEDRLKDLEDENLKLKQIINNIFSESSKILNFNIG